MEDFAGPLIRIEINNEEPEDDIPLLIDYNSEHCSCIHYASTIIVLFIVLCFSFVSSKAIIRKEFDFYTNNSVYTGINIDINGTIPLNGFLFCKLKMNGFNASYVTGLASYTIFSEKKGINYSIAFNQSSLADMPSFRSLLVDFQKVEIDILFNELIPHIIVIYEYFCSKFNLLKGYLMGICSVISIIQSVMFFIKTQNTKISFEQELTKGLCFCLVLYNDPFYLINLFRPSYFSFIRHEIFHDLFICYLFFYLIALSYYFDKDPSMSKKLNVAIPYLFMIVCVTYLLSEIALLPLNNIQHIFGDYSMANEQFNESFYYVFFSFSVFYLIRMFQIKDCIRPDHEQRFNIYSRIMNAFISFIVLIFVVYSFSPTFSAPHYLLIGVFTSVSLIFISLHMPIDDNDINTYKLQEDAEQINSESLIE